MMSDILNQSQLLDLAGDDITSFLPIINDFEQNGCELLDKIGAAISANNLEDIRAAAHQLKGSSGMLGMTRLFNQCKEIEQKDLYELNAAYLEGMRQTLHSSISSACEALENHSS